MTLQHIREFIQATSIKMHHDISRARECARKKSMKTDLFRGFLPNRILGITTKQTAVISIGQNIKRAKTPEHMQDNKTVSGHPALPQ